MLYSLKNVSKIISTPQEEIRILNSVNFFIEKGEMLAVLGASGSGKSTFLNILAGLDSPSSGEVFFEDKNIHALQEKEKNFLRNKEMGFVFQFHHLLPEFTTAENVAMQAIISGMKKSEALQKAYELLEMVELSHRAKHLVTTLSGGEKQRAAIARAVLLSPKVLLADEPTGNLDFKTGEQIMQVLTNLNKEKRMTLVMVTHNREIANQMQRVVELKSGAFHEQKMY
ncbi:ABC transporter ATP-binding protein [Taurinivorans muris]|uniref:ABC transporter ATP-binding protein n=1 Tax=Taurinivorans muris TaxID=2787751 RepID=A0ABY5Y0X8_9BACT|nr:ABC transporter ATP-binding protein [Desulfovibrionaceae bacterium LT0009]